MRAYANYKNPDPCGIREIQSTAPKMQEARFSGAPNKGFIYISRSLYRVPESKFIKKYVRCQSFSSIINYSFSKCMPRGLGPSVAT